MVKQILSPVLKEKGIYLGTVQVTGTIGSNDFYIDSAPIAAG